MLYAIDQDALEDFVLAHGDAELQRGETVPPEEVLADLEDEA